MAENYTVGYKKPPLAGRFRKGVSGNPRGRPQRSKSIEAMILAEGDGRVGKRRKLGLTIKRAWDRAAQGDLRSLEQLTKIAPKLEAQMRRASRPTYEKINDTDSDKEALRKFMATLDPNGSPIPEEDS